MDRKEAFAGDGRDGKETKPWVMVVGVGIRPRVSSATRNWRVSHRAPVPAGRSAGMRTSPKPTTHAVLGSLSVTLQPESFPLACSDRIPSFPASYLPMTPTRSFEIKAFYSTPLATVEIYALHMQL